jgi:hypothetical protein
MRFVEIDNTKDVLIGQSNMRRIKEVLGDNISVKALYDEMPRLSVESVLKSDN